jgi:hypothetical protein
MEGPVRVNEEKLTEWGAEGGGGNTGTREARLAVPTKRREEKRGSRNDGYVVNAEPSRRSGISVAP